MLTAQHILIHTYNHESGDNICNINFQMQTFINEAAIHMLYEKFLYFISKVRTIYFDFPSIFNLESKIDINDVTPT